MVLCLFLGGLGGRAFSEKAAYCVPQNAWPHKLGNNTSYILRGEYSARLQGVGVQIGQNQGAVLDHNAADRYFQLCHWRYNAHSLVLSQRANVLRTADAFF